MDGEFLDEKRGETILQQTQKKTRWEQSPIFPLIVTMSLPAILSMTVQAMYNIVDSYFVAKISENALTAVSLAFPMQNLIIAFACGIGVGVNSLKAFRKRGKQKEASDVAVHGLVLSVFASILFAVIGIFSPARSSGCLRIFRTFWKWERIIFLLFVFSASAFLLKLRLKKRCRRPVVWFPMVFQLIGAITNIILDPIFIFGYFGLPEMGVAGAAVATVAGQILSAVVSAVVIFTQKHAVKLSFRRFRMRWGNREGICEVGVPSTVMMSIGSIMTTLMNSILIVFTETAVAVFGVYYKLQSLIFYAGVRRDKRLYADHGV